MIQKFWKQLLEIKRQLPTFTIRFLFSFSHFNTLNLPTLSLLGKPFAPDGKSNTGILYPSYFLMWIIKTQISLHTQ